MSGAVFINCGCIIDSENYTVSMATFHFNPSARLPQLIDETTEKGSSNFRSKQIRSFPRPTERNELQLREKCIQGRPINGAVW